MTTYSRMQTHEKNKLRRNKRKRRLLALNIVLLACIAAMVAVVWLSQRDDAAATDGQISEPTASIPAASDKQDDTGQKDTSSAGEDDRDIEEDTVLTEGEESDDEGSAAGDGTVTLAFVGDILPAARVLDYMNQYGFDYPFRGSISHLQAADITAGNLETAISERGTAMENKEYTYRAPKEVLEPIKEAGFDFLSLANNHTLDFGWDALHDTLDALDDARIVHAGAGIDDKQAYTPAYMDANGTTVAFISLTRVVPVTEWKADKNNPGLAEAYSTTRAVAAINEARENADIVVVMVHWGEERSDLPNAVQKSLAYTFVDAGADLVIGSHPHVLQGFESYKDKWIAYSLGNFVFPGMSPPTTAETGVLTATCKPDGACSLQFAPMISKLAQPVPMSEEDGRKLFARLSSISFGATVEEDGNIVASNP